MSNKTIAKFSRFVIPLLLVGIASSACSAISSGDRRPQRHLAAASAEYGPPNILGRLRSADVDESSGLTASKCQNDVFWTHNDSGDAAFIFAFSSDGSNLSAFKVENAVNRDWEDMASVKDEEGRCWLYLGDIGNNDREPSEHVIYRVPEPALRPGAAFTRHRPGRTETAETLRFRYPDQPHDAESLLVHPLSGEIYVLTKRVDGPSGVYKIRPAFNASQLLNAEKIADLAVPSVPNGLLTGAAVSPDGKRVVVCDYSGGYEFVVPVSGTFDEVWQQKPAVVDLGDRQQGEAVTYSADGLSIISTSEGSGSPIFMVTRNK